MFWSSQSPKVLRGFNLFVILKQKRWEAPKDSKDSIFWRSWEAVPQIRKIEAFQHFGTVGAAKNTDRPQSFGILDLRKIEASQHFGTVEAAKH